MSTPRPAVKPDATPAGGALREGEGTDARQVPGQGTRRRRQIVHGVVLIDSMILPQVHLRNGEELCDSMLCLQSDPTIS
jgi:hypothetical protein